MLWASPEDAQLKKEIRQKLIQEEKECADCTKMRPEVLEREVNRIFASEKNKRLKVHKSAQ
jgi:Fe-S cluster assembly ATPase SufC